MPRIYYESEHQELFHLQADLLAPIPFHIPSALGTLGYFICVRVPQEHAGGFESLRVRLRVGGLRPDDVTAGYGEGLGEQAPRLSSTADGFCWLLIARVNASRGDAELMFEGVPDSVTRADVLLCTWPRFIESGQADEWIRVQSDPQWASGGIPLGGIGAGKVELSRDGRFRNFTGNNNQDVPLEEPDGLDGAYLAVEEGGEARLLATRPMCDIAPVDELTADLCFPQTTLAAENALPGVDVSVTAAAPFIPHDLKTSSLPGFILKWTVTNRGSKRKMVTCRLAWPNLVGIGGCVSSRESGIGTGDGHYSFWEAPEHPTAEHTEMETAQLLRYANAPSEFSKAADGFHYLAVATKGLQPEVHSDSRRGSVAAQVDLTPGKTVTVEMAVAWEMPVWVDTLGNEFELYWRNHCRDGREVIEQLLVNAEHIIQEGQALRQLLVETDLPGWLQARLCNCAYPLLTNSVLYRDGRFSINEGPTEMSGCYGTLDQRLAAHPATQLLFPELNEQELSQFAAYQGEDGGVNHDLGHGNLEKGVLNQAWPDLTCSFIIQLARHAWSMGDQDFEKRYWPRARNAFLRHKKWAEAGDGVAQVGETGLGTSYDGYHYHGTTPYMGTLWLAALNVIARWAERMNDPATARLAEELADQARARIEADLWNGDYYRAYSNGNNRVNENCHAGMLAGEWFSRMLAGTDVLPQKRLQACCESWLRLNGNDRFAVPPDEVSADLQQFTEYGWLPYVEGFGLAPLAVLGEKGMLPVWKRMVRAMDGNGKHPCDTRLMYRPTDGAPSWGAYYMTAPASWLVYDALLDFCYEPASETLRLIPTVTGAFAVVHPLFWGHAENAGGGQLLLTVKRVFGRSPLAVSFLDVPGNTTQVTVDGKEYDVQTDGRCYKRCGIDQVLLTPGTRLIWRCDVKR